jgi:PAS domain-containing protein
MSDREKRLWDALESAEADLKAAVDAARAARAAGDEFAYETARQSANEANERIMCLSHDIASCSPVA